MVAALRVSHGVVQSGMSVHRRSLVPHKHCVAVPRQTLQPSQAIGFENAPVEFIVGGGVLVVGSIAFLVNEALKAGKDLEGNQVANGGEWADEPASLPRENAVLVFGASGRCGKEIVAKLLKSGRTVVAAVRDSAKAMSAFKEYGISEGAQKNGGILFVEDTVDVTKPEMLSGDLFKGVTQVVVATGAVFGRDSNGNMGYIDGMTPEKVDAKGVEAIAAAAAKFLPKQKQEDVMVIPMASEKDLERWQKLDDVIMGGNSDSALALNETSTGFTWSGKLVVEGGGFCGARSYPDTVDLSGYDGVSLHVKGSGETLKLNIKTDDLNEPEDTYQATFDVPDGEWGDVFIPWHEFVPVKRARSVADGPPLNPRAIQQFGLVYSRFSFNGFPNPAFKSGEFSIEFDGGIKAVKKVKPQILLISSAGVERNALVGNDEEKRKQEIPIVQLNPGGILNHKYSGEIAVRSCGLPYAVLRPTGMSDDADQAAPSLLEMSQGDRITGKIARSDVAQIVDATLGFFDATGKTVEVRRSEASDAQGKSMADTQVQKLYLSMSKDTVRTRQGLLPFPAPVDPPAPVSEERKEEILADPRVKAATERGAGGRVRDADEENATTLTTMEDASRTGSNYEGKEGAREWIRQWRAKTLEKQLPEEVKA